MAFAEQSKVFVNFTGGLNTEATPLNFPENAAQAIDNFDLFITGEVKRRLGIDFEDAYIIRPETTSDVNTAAYAISTFEWRSVNGSGDQNFLVVQIGLRLYFHNLGDEPLSTNLRGTVDLSAFKTGPGAETRRLSAGYGEGIMIVGNAEIDPVMVQYDDETDSFSLTRIELKIRDFEGVKDGLATDERPTVISALHRYNLRNQGWPLTATGNNVERGSRGTSRNINPIDFTRTKIGVYPSNADLFYASKAVSANDAEVLNTYSPWALEHNSFGNTPAPKGHYVLDLFNQVRPGAEFHPTKQTDRRPSTLAFYAGRAWYAGVPDSQYTGNIFFSQSLTDLNHIGDCHQEYDPTAEDLNALLATDGGVIHIADLGEVMYMESIGADLVVFANNGVWAISGGEAHGNFQADSHSIRKISDQGTIGRETVVVAQGTAMWWGEGGIWLMSPNEFDGAWKVDRITRESIQTFYDNINSVSKNYARVFHDSFSKKVFWLYNDDDGFDGLNFRFKYNRALVLDMSLGAFYTYTISDLDENSPWISAMSLKAPGSEIAVEYDVWHLNDDVVEGADDIVQDISFQSFANVKIKALTFVQNEDDSYSYTFSEFKDRDFRDWETWDKVKNNISNVGKNFTSFIQSGWSTFEDLLRPKTITHLTSFFNRTEDGYVSTDDPSIVEFANPSSAIVQTRWEFTDLDIGRWTAPMQAYRLPHSYIPEDVLDPFNYGYEVIKSKLRMRGRGTGFSIRYSSEEGKDLQLIGFAVNVRAGEKV